MCKFDVSYLLNIKVVFDEWVGGKERKTRKNDELTVTECEMKLLFVINRMFALSNFHRFYPYNFRGPWGQSFSDSTSRPILL